MYFSNFCLTKISTFVEVSDSAVELFVQNTNLYLMGLVWTSVIPDNCR